MWQLSTLLYFATALVNAEVSSAAPFSPDEYTLLLSHFDGSCHADYARGAKESSGRGTVATKGRFGAAVRLERGDRLSLAGGRNFPGNTGTVEFWLAPAWNGDDGQTQSVLGAAAGDGNYLNINKLPSGRFGVGLSGGPTASDFTYRRADVDVKAWRAGEWHHVAVCWGDGELTLWIDGQPVAVKTGAVAPQNRVKEIHLLGNATIDELRVSNVVRYTPGGVVTGKPVRADTRAHPDWHFVEPQGVYRLPALPAGGVEGMVVVSKEALEQLEPSELPKRAAANELRLFAAPGQTEPAACVVLAQTALRALSVSVSDLRCSSHVLPSAAFTVRRVVRTPMRRLYTSRADQTEIVDRFLPRWTPLDVPAGEFREVWLSCDVPVDASPGIYTGELMLRHTAGTRRLPLRVEVLPIRLVEHPRKQLACYYRLENQLLDTPRVLRELRDMHAHGVRHLCSGLHARYERKDDSIAVDLTRMEQGLGLIRQAGYRNATVIVDSGLAGLAASFGVVAKKGSSPDVLEKNAQFQAAARQGVEAVLALARKFPELRLVLTHLDEVFNEDRLPLYIELSKAVRQVPAARLYITFHTRDNQADAWRQRIDPLVDIRCHHGYTFEWWLARGRSMAEYERELATAGDEAWFYHNARGVHFTAHWSRIINGLYLWASPFRAHCPWIYQAYFDNPFDDTDGGERAHDFGMSFPGIDDPADHVPTRLWEALRAGADDLRYLATLEQALADARATRPKEAAAAEKFLTQLRGLVQNVKLTDAGPAAATPSGDGPIDLDTGLRMGAGKIGSADEAPLIQALAKHLGASGSQQLRRQMADHILRLTDAKP